MSEHPPFPALRTDPLDPEVAAHLKVCPRCRVELRLLQEASEAPTEALVGLEQAQLSLGAIHPRGRAALADSLSAASGEAVPALVPGQEVERYVVEGRLGAGGMGTVYRVRHRTLGSLHALKLMHGKSPKENARLLREGRAQSRMRHPNLVAVTDVIEVDGVPGLIMDFVDGPSLAEWLRDEATPLDLADRWACGILRGVRAAHRAGFVHRDLKPANVLLAPVDDGLEPRVCDFGLVRLTEDDGTALTGTGTPIGTPSYMAPEQIRDASRADVRSDLFSLGAVLYELVTGVQAFPAHGLVDVWERMRDGAYTPPGERVPDLPERMASTIRRALRPDPADRFEDCDAMLAAWAGEADLVEPPPVRRRWPAVVAGVAILAVVLGGASALVAARRSVHASTTAVTSRRSGHASPTPSTEAIVKDMGPDSWEFAISGDGRHVAFTEQGTIWRLDIDGGAPHRLANGDYHSVDFLPDGKTLLAAGPQGVWRIDSDGTADQLTDVGALGIWVAPDGSRLALMGPPTGGAPPPCGKLWLAGPDATGRRPLTAEGTTTGVAWSPDSRFLATLDLETTEFTPTLRIIDVENGTSRTIAGVPAYAYGGVAQLAWVQPDTLLLGFGRQDPATLRMVPHASVAAPEAFRDPAVVYTWPKGSRDDGMVASRDGSRIVYRRNDDTRELVRFVPTEPGQKSWPAPTFAEYSHPAGAWLSPDEVAVIAGQGGHAKLYAQPVRTADTRLLATDVTNATWAGDALLASRPGGGPYEISLLRIPISGGSARELNRFHGKEPWVPPLRCSSEGRVRCLVGEREGERLELTEVDPVTGARGAQLRTVEWPTNPDGWDLSPDGRFLALARRDEVEVVDLATGAERSLPLDFMTQFVAWTPDGSALDVSGIHHDGGYELLQVSLDGDTRSLWQSADEWIWRVSPSPDGKLVAIGTRRFADQLWKLDGVMGQ